MNHLFRIIYSVYFRIKREENDIKNMASAGTFTYVHIPVDADQPCTEETVSFANFEEKVYTPG